MNVPQFLKRSLALLDSPRAAAGLSTAAIENEARALSRDMNLALMGSRVLHVPGTSRRVRAEYLDRLIGVAENALEFTKRHRLDDISAAAAAELQGLRSLSAKAIEMDEDGLDRLEARMHRLADLVDVIRADVRAKQKQVVETAGRPRTR